MMRLTDGVMGLRAVYYHRVISVWFNPKIVSKCMYSFSRKYALFFVYVPCIWS